MLPAQHRLRNKRDVERVSRKGRPAFARTLTVRHVANNLPVVRATAVAGLKVSKRATQRNRVKRLIRESLRREFLTRIPPGHDIVVYAKKELIGKTYQEVVDELGYALRKAGLLKRADVTRERKA
ncbi:MAG: ribonuclease P protein component [bacterium]|nr:ribonuclease P protein component [bacterium]